MRIKARNFPHPVLNPINDDFQNSSFTGEITEYTEKNDGWEFSIRLNLNNPEIKYLIQTKKASFNIHFECNSTMQRLMFCESQEAFKIFIAKEHLNKKVDVNFLILGDQRIKNYTNSDTHPDYSGVEFNIQKGDILAYSESQTIHIEKQAMSNTNSIFKVSKASDPKASSIDVDWDGAQIEIMLPELSYEKVGNLQAYGNDCNKVLISMLYFPALTATLFYVQNVAMKGEYELDEINDSDWYRTLEKKIKSMGYDITKLESYEIIKISYDLLNSSPEASFVSLEHIVFNTEGED